MICYKWYETPFIHKNRFATSSGSNTRAFGLHYCCYKIEFVLALTSFIKYQPLKVLKSLTRHETRGVFLIHDHSRFIIRDHTINKPTSPSYQKPPVISLLCSILFHFCKVHVWEINAHVSLEIFTEGPHIRP